MRATYLKVGVLLAVSALATSVLVSLMSDVKVDGDQAAFHAIVSDASLLKVGDAVRIAGVTVGQVNGLEFQPDETVKVDFTVREDQALPGNVRAAIRYKNLIGDRVLVLTNPDPDGGSSTLTAGATIPLTQTEPALDLDALTGGFRPLLAALEPEAVNELSANVLAIVQGEGGSVQQAVQSIAQVAEVVADQGVAVDRLIGNLASVMAKIDSHSEALDTLVDRLESLVRTANDEREPIVAAVRDIGDFADVLADLLEEGRPPIKDVLTNAEKVAATLNREEKMVTDFLNGWGPAYQKAAGIGVYGDFFNFYVCDLRIKATGPNGQPIFTPWVESGDARCAYEEKP